MDRAKASPSGTRKGTTKGVVELGTSRAVSTLGRFNYSYLTIADLESSPSPKHPERLKSGFNKVAGLVKALSSSEWPCGLKDGRNLTRETIPRSSSQLSRANSTAYCHLY